MYALSPRRSALSRRAEPCIPARWTQAAVVEAKQRAAWATQVPALIVGLTGGREKRSQESRGEMQGEGGKQREKISVAVLACTDEPLWDFWMLVLGLRADLRQFPCRKGYLR